MITLYSEEFLKLFVEKQKEPVTEMLKDNLPLSKILKYSRKELFKIDFIKKEILGQSRILLKWDYALGKNKKYD